MEDSQKRMIMAIVASFLFLMVWSTFFGPKPQKNIQPQELPNKETEINLTDPKSSPTPKKVITSTFEGVKPETVIEQNAFFEARLNNQHAVVDTLILKDFKESLEKQAQGIQVIPFALEAPAPLLWAFEAQTEDETFRIEDQSISYAWQSKSSPYQMKFSQETLDVEKTFQWDPQTYQLTQSVVLSNNSSKTISVQATTQMASTQDPETQNRGFFSLFQAPKTPIGVLSYIGDEEHRWDFAKIEKGKVEVPQGNIGWAGFESQYFLLSLRPVESLWNNIRVATEKDLTTLTYQYPKREIKAGSSIRYQVALYAGPKDIDILTHIDETMKHGIDLGHFLGPIARVILKTLRALYGWFHNYGVAIILLTIMVRLLMFPLAQKQAKSMKKMQVHKPAMDALKEQYKDDREAHSKALMEYMKTNRINPAGGCLPLLVQFPIFIALYKVLYNSIELRHEPFIFWIQDLSAHDPFFVLPALVGLTFFFQMKINPTPMGDPAQQAVMKIMPVMFSVLMIFLPSGLNLYIFISTLWGIVQQYWVQKSNV